MMKNITMNSREKKQNYRYRHLLWDTQSYIKYSYSFLVLGIRLAPPVMRRWKLHQFKLQVLILKNLNIVICCYAIQTLLASVTVSYFQIIHVSDLCTRQRIQAKIKEICINFIPLAEIHGRILKHVSFFENYDVSDLFR